MICHIVICHNAIRKHLQFLAQTHRIHKHIHYFHFAHLLLHHHTTFLSLTFFFVLHPLPHRLLYHQPFPSIVSILQQCPSSLHFLCAWHSTAPERFLFCPIAICSNGVRYTRGAKMHRPTILGTHGLVPRRTSPTNHPTHRFDGLLWWMTWLNEHLPLFENWFHQKPSSNSK